MRIERAAAAAALVVMSACITEEVIAPPVGNTLVVHAVLDPSSRDQVVDVEIASGALRRLEIIHGASVRLSLPDGRQMQASEDTTAPPPPAPGMPLVPATTFIYHFSLDTLGFELVPGGTYRLEVRVPDGRVVTGHTTIPLAQPVPLDVPVDTIHYERDTVRLRWRRFPAARAYELVIVNEVDRFRRSNSFFAADTAADITTSTKAQNGDTFLFAGLSNRIAVTAVDSNYFDYYRRDSDFLTGVGVISHLDGAEGLFGSVVPIAARSLKVVF